MTIEKALEEIRELGRPAIIAISGFGGSGKSTTARQISTAFNVPLIGIDSFWKATSGDDYQYWEIVDYKRLEQEILRPFTEGKEELTYSEFDWSQNKLGEPTTIIVKDILVIEGIGLFRPKLMPYYAYTIWIDCPIAVAIARGKKRDREEYGVPQDENWDGIWHENDLQCFEAFSPLDNANCIIRNY